MTNSECFELQPTGNQLPSDLPGPEAVSYLSTCDYMLGCLSLHGQIRMGSDVINERATEGLSPLCVSVCVGAALSG